MKVGSDSTFRDKFLLGAAKAFFVTAYADYVEEGHSTDNDLTDEEREERLSLSRPGGGQDWMDYAPEPPPAAFALAGELWAKLEKENKQSVYILAGMAAEADGKTVDVENFGHYLAMQAMGHGVSWFDDHEEFDLKIPHIECSQCSFSDAAFRGEEE